MLASGLFFQGGWYFFRLKIILNGYRPFVGCFPGTEFRGFGVFCTHVCTSFCGTVEPLYDEVLGTIEVALLCRFLVVSG